MDKDIYNLKEATFFYKILPKRTHTTTGGYRTKASKERVSVLFEANATGDHKLPLLIRGG
ncbi:hypothetical protein HPB47_021738 [Ixodes persulcatus]|uniref:Uncharacterized protein n=1 Tax=Ixodes persulcatus TaxID=34615 RepID=A0AC60QC05_IXOPE|nr:hypothetical protein HPB47_021738 [Ixodes persulcatus]